MTSFIDDPYLSNGLCASRDTDEDDDAGDAEAQGQLSMEVSEVFEAER